MTRQAAPDAIVRAEIAHVVERLRMYYTDAEVERCLTEPHPQLHGATALSVIEAGRADEVHAIIDRLESSVFL